MRLEEKFEQLKLEGRKAFIAYVPYGFPDIKLTKEICLRLQDSGVDIIELGIPFSDPLADGPIIQRATSAALQKGANIEKCFISLSQMLKSLKIPVVLMTYYNPIYRYGLKKFFLKMKQLGVTAVTVVDLPLEESKEYIELARNFDIETVFFATPTTSKQRLVKIVRQSRGFLYYISVTGITGPRNLQYSPLIKYIKQIKSISKIPVCVGFGIHSRAQIKKICSFSDGVIVGSSIVRFIEDNYQKSNFLDRLQSYVKSLLLNNV
ncbi:MAG: tryptophan synthase subunit alpha [Candidatus Omnitrophica bacterium]|nr:tryptophan synthase subunit alpha [Candidatus Omnitrophota bacterium]